MSEQSEMQAAVREIRDDVKDLLGRQAATSATLDLMREQVTGQVEALFAKADRTGAEVQAIKVDYTPRREHAETQQRLTAVERQQLRWAGALALLLVVGQGLIALLGKVLK